MAFIDEMVSRGHAVEPVCAVLTEQGCQVAARTYRAWKQPGQQLAARVVSDALIEDAIWATTGTPEQLYGAGKMTDFLRRTGHPGVAYCTVRRIMRELGRRGVRRGRAVRTTIANPKDARAADLLNRDFTAGAPNTRWVADFTYVPCWVGFVYVAFCVDVFAQRIVGWHAAYVRDTKLVLTCLQMAVWQRARLGHPVRAGDLIHRSDAGSQYTAVRFTEHLALEGITPSIGSVGDAYDNGLMESIIGLYKTECIDRPHLFGGGEPLRTRSDVEHITMAWVDWWNTRRLLGRWGNIPPAEKEAAYYAGQPEPFGRRTA